LVASWYTYSVDKHVEEGINTVIKDCIGVDDVTDISQHSFVWLHENTTLLRNESRIQDVNLSFIAPSCRIC